MLYKSALVTAASGSIGGITASHNKGGNYLRARTIPTDPGTVQQQVVRGAVANLMARWVETLSEAQREDWKTWAINVPSINALGESRTLPANACYARCNVPRIQAGLPIIDFAPTVFDLAVLTGFTIVAVDSGAGTIDIGFDEGDAWVIADGAALLVYCSRQQNESIQYFKGPYRFAGAVLGDSATPPTSPATLTLPFPVAVDNKVFAQGRVTQADSRPSAPFRFGALGE